MAVLVFIFRHNFSQGPQFEFFNNMICMDVWNVWLLHKLCSLYSLTVKNYSRINVLLLIHSLLVYHYKSILVTQAYASVTELCIEQMVYFPSYWQVLYLFIFFFMIIVIMSAIIFQVILAQELLNDIFMSCVGLIVGETGIHALWTFLSVLHFL